MANALPTLPSSYFQFAIDLSSDPTLDGWLQRSTSLEDTNPSILLQVRQEATLRSWASLLFNSDLRTNSVDIRGGPWPF